MGVPQFDFRTSEEVPSGGRRFAPLDEVKNSASQLWSGIVLLLVVGLAVGAVMLQRWLLQRERKQRESKRWQRLRETCTERGLTEVEIGRFLKALRETRSLDPENCLLSLSYFNSMIAPGLGESYGPDFVEGLRRKLFFAGKPSTEEEEGFGGTRELRTGQNIRLHFDGIAGTFACTIINNMSTGFIAAFNTRDKKRPPVAERSRVEGHMELGNTFYAFESRVEEIYHGSVFACRIAHSTEVRETHRRQFTRVFLGKKVTFSHIPAASMGNASRIDMASVETHAANRCEGVFRDISAGGCSIITPSRYRFEVGDFVQFVFHLLEDEPAHQVLGQVIHLTPLVDSSQRGIILHAQFLGLDDEAQGSLARTVYALQQRMGDRS